MELELEAVGMQHAHQPPVLRELSFAIPAKTRVALIGQSGVGKSTVASLLRRDYDPTSGRIVIDGRDLREYRLSSVLRHMGVILQRPEVLSGTVRENILHGVSDRDYVSDETIWRVVDQVSPALRERFGEHGLNTKVGKQGLQLSGGEQQRLCVIRALVKDPAFLIVDEATSSLDSETERVVQQGIDAALSRGISALVIAHRFSTLENCNQFVVLKKLRDCEPGESQVEAITGSMSELYHQSPTFRRLADQQGFNPNQRKELS